MNALGSSNVPWLAAPVIPRSLTSYPVLNTTVEQSLGEKKRRIHDTVREKSQSHPDVERANVLLNSF